MKTRILVWMFALAVIGPVCAMAQNAAAARSPGSMQAGSGAIGASGDSSPAHTIEVNGARICYRVSGQGEPLLLMHGYPLNGNLFVHQRESLSRNFKVITPDLRGFGCSEAPNSDASLKIYAEDMFGLMDKLNIKKAIIGGHSMGGMTTIEMYKEHPERFAGMILIDTAAMNAPLPLKNEWEGFAELGKQPGHDKMLDALLVPAMLSANARMHDMQLVNYVKQMVNAASVNGIEGGGKALATRPDNRDVLSQVKVPTLIIVGSADPVTPFEVSQKMHAAIPGSKLAIIEGGSHAVILEKSREANQAVLQWAQGSHLTAAH